ncbi:MAG TPA: hypothetical protein VE131_15210, partial [Terriglobales bacterium]|nr:hypothetical protein [Terriglobales bacterium]
MPNAKNICRTEASRYGSAPADAPQTPAAKLRQFSQVSVVESFNALASRSPFQGILTERSIPRTEGIAPSTHFTSKQLALSAIKESPFPRRIEKWQL